MNIPLFHFNYQELTCTLIACTLPDCTCTNVYQYWRWYIYLYIHLGGGILYVVMSDYLKCGNSPSREIFTIFAIWRSLFPFCMVHTSIFIVKFVPLENYQFYVSSYQTSILAHCNIAIISYYIMNSFCRWCWLCSFTQSWYQ